ncbi:MAG: DEAD/DEAH box helicase, partial [Phycisphaerales bacterium]|nr:DEAD/DEAH box helicase [Phycisphaerales bacterium]
MTTVLHANWTAHALALWAEEPAAHASDRAEAVAGSDAPAGVLRHSFAVPAAALRTLLKSLLPESLLAEGADASILLRLPVQTTDQGQVVPVASPRAAHAIGHDADADPALSHALRAGESGPIFLESLQTPALRFPPTAGFRVLEALDGVLSVREAVAHQVEGIVPGPGLDYLIATDHFAQWLLVQQRFVPALIQDVGGGVASSPAGSTQGSTQGSALGGSLGGGVRGIWQPWLADEAVATRAGILLRAMPPASRAAVDSQGHDAWSVLEDFLVHIVDARARAIMIRETMADTIEGRRSAPSADGTRVEDPHVTWLAGLLDQRDAIDVIGQRRSEMLKRVRTWIGGLDQRSSDSAWRLCLKLVEPVAMPDGGVAAAVATGPITLQDPGDKAQWNLVFLLQSVEQPGTTVAAADIWILPTDGAMVAGKRLDSPQELLLAELGRAARVYRPLESALSDAEPAKLALTTQQAYEFLREHRQLLLEQGFGVLSPAWWDSPAARLGVRLKLDAPETLDGAPPGSGAGGAAGALGRLGLQALVNYKWSISLGTTTLSIDEFQKLATLKSPLVYVGGKWVEVRPEDIKAAVEFLRENPGGQMEIGRALRMAYGVDPRSGNVPVTGIEATGWAASIFGSTGTSEGQKNFTMPMLDAPEGFVGSLRPYQIKGLSWLAFLDRIGLGACLADDMGLGKTIQLLAMLLHERRTAAEFDATVGPSLLIVPMSVVGNWTRETRRFAPSLRIYVHHGPDRKLGDALRETALASDLVITTYALAHRDRADMEKIAWHRVALDEAQNIKNPAAKQTQAV